MPAVVWAAGDQCPRCGTALKVERPGTSGPPESLGARSRGVGSAGSGPLGGMRAAADIAVASPRERRP